MPISVQTLPFDDEHSSCQSAHQDSLPTCSPAQVQAHTITHVNVFLGSLTFTSEQLASSLAEKAKQQGAVVSIQSLEEFKSEQYLDVNSSCRAPSRVAVFVVSTHAAGKPSPNAERFLLWLRTTSDLNRTVTKDHKTQEDAYVTRTNTPYAPATDTSTVFTPGPRKRQTSLSQAIIDVPTHPPGTRPGFRLTWRLPFSGVDSSKSECKSIGPLKSFQYAVFGVGNSIYRTYNSTAKYIDTTLEQLGATRICSLGLGDISKNIDAVFTSWES
ncbi:unnamed protein product [Phytophthora lilii]|uniref:Unnamed protein product n=1 Tax=Phytophthora lilii TaxID=2077276 RepID=A0A9W6WQQ2_9STRA|nr:unnamed protein product [Phytophthora lilii]